MLINHDNDELFARLLLQQKLLTAETVEALHGQARHHAQSLFNYCIQHRCIDPEKWLQACESFHPQLTISIETHHFSELPHEALSVSILKTHMLLPIAKNEKKLVVAIANPYELRALKSHAVQTGCAIEWRWIRYDHLCQWHNQLINTLEYAQWKHGETHQAQKIVHHLLSDAIHQRASDIHIEPYHRVLRIRFRLDGILHEIIQLPKTLGDPIISCIKVLAHLDIAIKRTPQDGRLTLRSYLGFVKECRVSTCPIMQGEKVVIRLLEANTQLRGIHELGLREQDQKILLKSIQKPQGLILITGPTGSGKTITLYTLLNLLNQCHRNIVTLEDPVEVQIEGINQTPILSKAGLTFSNMLRTLLRQDPDVMMIGEIRDSETAEMAIRAAQTGHLVLSTLHTNTAAEAIIRLQQMGVATYHLSTALTLIVAQRLVRRLCSHCATAHILPKKTLEQAGFSAEDVVALLLKKPTGCTQCTRGFQGRIGIFELLPITFSMKQHILRGGTAHDLDAQNQCNHQLSLWQMALQSVKEGLTSLDEVYRVIPREEVL